MNREALLAKIRALQKRAATDGERKAAERAARRIIEKYGLDDAGFDEEETERDHFFCYATKRDRKLLLQIAAALLGADIVGYISRGTRHLCIRTTDLQAAEIEYQYDYFRHLYREEEEMLFVAFLHKHNLFSKDGGSGSEDSEEVDPEYLARIVALMHGLNDSQLRKALPEEGR